MAGPTLLHVTQVAPYRDGPAGVHGVLDQSAVAVAQLAESAGLDGRRVTDVRDLEPDDLAAARVVALFTIGETPWSPDQRDGPASDGVRSGRTALVAIHSATDACYGWDAYGRLVGARFDGHPWTRTCTLDVARPRPSGRGPPRARPGGGTTRSTRSGTYAPTPGCCWRPGRPSSEPRRRPGDAADRRLPAVVVLHRGVGSGLLDLARALPPGLGEPGLPAPPGRWPGLGPGRGRRLTPDLAAPPAGQPPVTVEPGHHHRLPPADPQAAVHRLPEAPAVGGRHHRARDPVQVGARGRRRRPGR